MTPEQKTALEKVNTYTESARDRPLIERGWICNQPNVKAVWFVGYLPNRGTKEARIKLEIFFENGARHAILQKEVEGLEGDIEELLAQKGDEYLRNGGTGTMYKFSDLNPE